MDHSEEDRLRRVYEHYRQAGFASTKWSKENIGNNCIVEERLACLRCMLSGAGKDNFTDLDILDVGCGGGDLLHCLTGFGADVAKVFGTDLLPTRLAQARDTNPTVGFAAANAAFLPFPNDRFDVVTVFTVFTSVLDSRMAQNIAEEIWRVLRPDGVVAWYDFRFDSPSNRDVRGIGRAGIRRLFPSSIAEIRSITLLPPLARRLGPATPWLYPLLAAIPVLRSHYLAVIRKPA